MAYRYFTRWAAAVGVREESQALIESLGSKGAKILGFGVYDSGEVEGGYFVAFSDEVNDCKSDVTVQFSLEEGKGVVTLMVSGYSRKAEGIDLVDLGKNPERALLKAVEASWAALRETPEYRFIMRLS